MYDAYCAYYQAAMDEARKQMTAAWHSRPTRKDREVPIGQPLAQPKSAAAREVFLKAMRESLRK